MRLSKSVISELEINAVVEVLKKEYLGMGPKVLEFEKSLEAYIGGDIHVACVSTGTAALQLALQALELEPQSEIIIPSLTFVASFQAALAANLIPIACDIDPLTGLMTVEDLKNKITPQTKAVMYVHYASKFEGRQEIIDFCVKNNLKLVEDAAHSFGSNFKGKKIGASGDLICFSFDGIKNITSGEGGAVCSRDPELIQKIKVYRTLAIEKETESKYQQKRNWEVDVKTVGWRYHMGEIYAAIGLTQLKRLESEFAPKRKALCRLYKEKLKNIPNIIMLHENTNFEDVVAHIFPLRILGGKRNALRDYLAEHKIETGVHYKPNHYHELFNPTAEKLPKVEKLYEEILTLPLHPNIEISEVDIVVDKIKDFLKN